MITDLRTEAEKRGFGYEDALKIAQYAQEFSRVQQLSKLQGRVVDALGQSSAFYANPNAASTRLEAAAAAGQYGPNPNLNVLQENQATPAILQALKGYGVGISKEGLSLSPNFTYSPMALQFDLLRQNLENQINAGKPLSTEQVAAGEEKMTPLSPAGKFVGMANMGKAGQNKAIMLPILRNFAHDPGMVQNKINQYNKAGYFSPGGAEEMFRTIYPSHPKPPSFSAPGTKQKEQGAEMTDEAKALFQKFSKQYLGQ